MPNIKKAWFFRISNTIIFNIINILQNNITPAKSKCFIEYIFCFIKKKKKCIFT